MFRALTLLLACATAVTLSAGNPEEPSCNAHVVESCLEPGNDWTTGSCNAVHGGIKGNADNLHVLMSQHFQDSFKFMIMGSHFNTDEVNRLGLHGYIEDHSNKMWDHGKDIMKYILKRGGRMGEQFRVKERKPQNNFYFA